MSKTVIISDGPVAWRHLNGIFSVYKHTDVAVERVKNSLVTILCRSLNQLKPRPISKFVEIDGPPDDLGVIIRPDYADHSLVVGPRYQPKDIRLTWATYLGRRTSGVLVMGVNNGTRQAMKFHETRPLRTYRIKGLFGLVTDNMFSDGRVLGKAKFDHVKRSHLDRVLASFQAQHQKHSFALSGVDLQSQTAYELASKGLLRPEKKTEPCIYGFNCLHFEPPNFTIELHCVNEHEDYLLNIIHQIGQRLRTLAICTGLQCIRHGCFTTEHSLIQRCWTVDHVISSITEHTKLLRDYNISQEPKPFLVKTESN